MSDPQLRRAGSRQRALEGFLRELRPHWRSDPALPARIEQRLRGDRRLGSRDRRLYRELIYTALRYLPWIEPLLDQDFALAARRLAWLAADGPETGPFREALAGDWPPCPPGVAAKAAHLGADASALLPGWLRSECPEAAEPGADDALLARAPLWLRLSASGAEAALDEMTRLGWAWRRSELLPSAVALPFGTNAAGTGAYREGRIEVQDLGSQLILESAGIAPGGVWLDACAGAGGKALQLAEILGADGRLDAHDVRPEALEELGFRAERAGLAGRIRRPSSFDAAYDGVLVDAPCSGSGTWRRSPHLKWTTSPEKIAAQARRQGGLLAQWAPRVRPAGLLIYATCSLCRSENEAVARAFLASHPDFASAPPARPFRGRPRDPGLAFWPGDHDGDGFFVAAFRRAG